MQKVEKPQLAGNTVWNICIPGRPSYSINFGRMTQTGLPFTKGLDNAHFAV